MSASVRLIQSKALHCIRVRVTVGFSKLLSVLQHSRLLRLIRYKPIQYLYLNMRFFCRLPSILLVLFFSALVFGAVHFDRSHHHRHGQFPHCRPQDRVSYTAAVLEFEPRKDWTGTEGAGVLQANVDSIAGFAGQAKSYGADIFVAPEYGVQSLNMYTNDTDMFLSLTQTIPDPALGLVPCDNDTDAATYQAVHSLSCVARTLQLYLVVDMAEQAPCNPGSRNCHATQLQYYNTQVVYDRTGAVIARYRKQNLYLEPQFTPGPQVDEQALFTTDFGVTFSLQICFDITYKHPAYNNVKLHGVRDVIMSTAWVDEVPFLPAINVQNGWSRSLGVNLMVSGYHWPEHTKMGSGIYRGYTDLSNAYSYDPDSGNELVVAPVATCKTAETTRPVEQPMLPHPVNIKYPRVGRSEREHVMLHEDLSVYNRTVLERTTPLASNYVQLCHHDGLCCTLQYQHYRSELTYQFLAFSGMLVKGGGTYRIYSQVCAVVWCDGDDWETCAIVDQVMPQDDVFGPFVLEGNYIAEAVFPVAMYRNLTLIPNDEIDYSVVESTQTLEMENGNSLMSVALFGRCYDKDPQM